MKIWLLFFLLPLLTAENTIYHFHIKALDGRNLIRFENFKGKKILIVNTASKSPYTLQLRELQYLYNTHREKLVVVCLPAGDDFGDQELATNKDIRRFCCEWMRLSFPISEKLSTQGKQQSPMIKYLVDEAKKLGYEDPVIRWNFTKFLVDENGKLIRVYPPELSPLSETILREIDNKTAPVL